MAGPQGLTLFSHTYSSFYSLRLKGIEKTFQKLEKDKLPTLPFLFSLSIRPLSICFSFSLLLENNGQLQPKKIANPFT